MNEHANNLRRTRADMLGTEDNDHYLECQRAATYIERLEAELKVWKPDFDYEGKCCPECGRKSRAQ